MVNRKSKNDLNYMKIECFVGLLHQYKWNDNYFCMFGCDWVAQCWIVRYRCVLFEDLWFCCVNTIFRVFLFSCAVSKFQNRSTCTVQNLCTLQVQCKFLSVIVLDCFYLNYRTNFSITSCCYNYNTPHCRQFIHTHITHTRIINFIFYKWQ